jgi:hypothetical protein
MRGKDAAPDKGRLKVGYLRGKQLLMHLAQAHPGKRITSGRRRDRAVRAVAHLVAAEHWAVVDEAVVDEVIEDAALACAVDAVAEACGEEARAFLLGSGCRVSAEAVMQASRCHPERQRYELGQAMQGRPFFAKPAGGCDPPYDTLGYHEVVSRLLRAEGSLRKQARVIEAHRPPEEVAAEAMRCAEGTLAAARQHARVMRLRLSRPGPAPAAGPSPPPAASPWGRVLGGISSACALAAKNARDIPRMLGGMVPTGGERALIRDLLSRIRLHASRIVSLLGGGQG